MTFRRFSVDWKMVIGFGGLLLLIIVMGLIGIQQIRDLSAVVTRLARTDIPLQNAVAEMKSSNSKYAIGIRSYIFWKSARYLDAASIVEKLNLVRSATDIFDKNISFYASRAFVPAQKDWVRTLRESQDRLRVIGDEIINLADIADQADPVKKLDVEASINKKLMDFESKLFQIDAFLDDPLQKHNLGEIEARLARADVGKIRSVSFLIWSLLIALGLGAQTAFLTYRRSKKDSEHRELLARTVIKVEEEEKNNLSMQIHDQMGQDLSALKIYLGLIERDLDPVDVEQRERIEKTKKILDGLMQKTHNISEILRPPEIDDLGLLESIGALILQYGELTGFRIEFVRPPEELKLSPEYSLVIYRVVQEALTNVAKYSKAQNVSVALHRKGPHVFLSVMDDGAGFDSSSYFRTPSRRKDDKQRLGLQGLRERIELFGGRLRIDSRAGGGTRLHVELPAV
jgi:signal transduction histidine kinase